MRIALAGTGPLGAAPLSALLDSTHEVTALLRTRRSPPATPPPTGAVSEEDAFAAGFAAERNKTGY